jgi:serine/threonine protein kinase
MNKNSEIKNDKKENLTEEYQKIGNYIVNKQIIIAKGSFGKIYKGHHNKTGEPVAIKTENDENNHNNSLRHETRILQHLYENGVRKIPPIYWYGKSTFDNINSQVLILPFYSCNLETYIQNKPLSKTQLSALIIKCLDIVQQIHSKFVVHRDIKPANFMIKNGDIYLIDFGLATFYVDEYSQLLEDDKKSSMIGTVKFASLYIHKGHRYTRRDDLISLVYMYDYMKRGGAISWNPTVIMPTEGQYSSSSSRTNILHPVNQQWMQSKEDNLLALSDKVLFELYNFVYSMKYDETPDYAKMKSLFYVEV